MRDSVMSGAGAVSISGVRIDGADRAQAARLIVDAAARRERMAVHLCNAYVLSLAAGDPEYARLLDSGDLNLADGVPVAWYARRAGLRVAERPSGTELVREVVGVGLSHGIRHYLYGATAEVVTRLAESLSRQFPAIEIVGVDAPPFGPVTTTQVAELRTRLDATGADVVWVGLGTPKQDHLVEQLGEHFAGPIVPVGAAFDFLAGTKRRAPRWIRRAGLEWLHRLWTEPRRLWKRYLWGNARFVWVLLRTGRVLDRGAA